MTNVHLLRTPDAHKALEQLHSESYNYTLEHGDPTKEDGWTIDHYCCPLPSEAPGAPEAGGPWEIACRLIRDYEFADPHIIKAVFLPDAPLLHRDMLLEAKFFGLRFLIGVRVAGVVDETCERDGRQVRRWGWSYRTLQGHLEMGEMGYEAWKWLDTGEVEFRIHRYVKTGIIPNPIIRLGWDVFGRPMQVRFVHKSEQRMQQLVAEELQSHRTGEPPEHRVPRASDEVEVSSATGKHAERLADQSRP
ncbi:MAG: DUF1990 family protein [Actinomycetes bacterium]